MQKEERFNAVPFSCEAHCEWSFIAAWATAGVYRNRRRLTLAAPTSAT